MEILNLTWDSFDDWQEKYGRDADPVIYAKAFTIWQFFNGVGLMLKDGLVPVRTIYEYMGFSIIIQWTKWEKILVELRGRGRYMEWFEYLYRKMIEYENQHPELKT